MQYSSRLMHGKDEGVARVWGWLWTYAGFGQYFVRHIDEVLLGRVHVTHCVIEEVAVAWAAKQQ